MQQRTGEQGTAKQPDALIDSLIGSVRLRAGGFIVTIYGDVVEPRGGHVWIGNLIETCASVGINESLVRTAVSRLVSADRLKGSREGRRSYYSLSETAQSEFVLASKRIFEPLEHQKWCFVWQAEADQEAGTALLEPAGFRRLATGWWLGPQAHLPRALQAVVFEASTAAPPDLIRSMAASHWDLAPLSEAYEAFGRMFAPILDCLASGGDLTPARRLQVRLLMVHQFRQVALRDPDLPATALPQDWAGHRARALFGKLYQALSDGADAYVSQHFVSASGALPARTPAIERRLDILSC